MRYYCKEYTRGFGNGDGYGYYLSHVYGYGYGNGYNYGADGPITPSMLVTGVQLEEVVLNTIFL